jgi:hypothetical protein
MIAKEVNQVLLERAIKASIGSDAEREERLYHKAEERVYHEAMLEVDVRKRHQAVLAGQNSPPSPEAMLHQEMVCARAQRR